MTSSTPLLIATDEDEYILAPGAGRAHRVVQPAPRRAESVAPARRRKWDHSASVRALTEIHAARVRGDAAMVKKLTQAFLSGQVGFAESYAARWAALGEEEGFEDLRQAAMLGLCEAVSRWAPAESGGGWCRYAYLWMRAMVSQLVHKCQLVRESDGTRADRRELDALRRARPGISDEEAAEALGWEIERVWDAVPPMMCGARDADGQRKGRVRRTARLSDEWGVDGDGDGWGDGGDEGGDDGDSTFPGEQ